MKHLKNFESYKIIDKDKKGDMNLFYFKTPENNYEVKIIPYQGKENYYSVGFGVIRDKEIVYDTSVVVNENPYQIMDMLKNII